MLLNRFLSDDLSSLVHLNILAIRCNKEGGCGARIRMQQSLAELNKTL